MRRPALWHAGGVLHVKAAGLPGSAPRIAVKLKAGIVFIIIEPEIFLLAEL